MKVVILTSYDLEVYVHACLAICVHGYLLKSASDLELIDAVRAVCRGEQALGPEIAARLSAPRRAQSGASALSPREREVLALVATGASNREVGQQLGLKETTIESYLTNLMAKLGARSRTEAVTIAVAQGLITLDPRATG